MAHVIQFEETAVARLRDRLGAAETARNDLLAFARGHSGIVRSIHAAVLDAVRAPGPRELVQVITHDWPDVLGIDDVCFLITIGEESFRCDRGGIDRIDPRFVAATTGSFPNAIVRSVERGHSLFGGAADGISTEAILPVDCGPGLPHGLLLLGHRQGIEFNGEHGCGLLMFLADSLAAIIGQWLNRP